MKKIVLLLILLGLFTTCKKDKDNIVTVPPITQTSNLSFTSDSASTQPGILFTIKSSNVLKLDTVTVTLDSKPILLAKIDSFHYAFIIPVLNEGQYTLNLKKLNSVNNLEIRIRPYSQISNPDFYLSTTLKTYHDICDSLFLNSPKNLITSSDTTFIHQLLYQVSYNFQKCTNEEKLLIAYCFQNISIDKSFFGKTKIDTAYLAQGSIENLDEVSKLATGQFIISERSRIIAYASIPIFTASLAMAVLVPNPVATTALTLSAITLVLNAKASIKAVEESIQYLSVTIENSMSEENGNGTAIKPIVATVGKTITGSFLSLFRTIKKSDNQLNEFITKGIIGSIDLERTGVTLKTRFDNITSILKDYFSQVNVSFSSFVSPIKEASQEKIMKLRNNFITVTNISNPNISVTATGDGLNDLKLTFDNPAKNITTETDFTFQLTYTQEAINKKVAITQYAKFKPLIKPSITTAIVGSITSSSATSGGIITNDGGGDITSKGLFLTTISNPNPFADILNAIPAGAGSGSFVTNLTGLKPNTTYFVRAYAQNNAGLGFGNEISFTTKDLRDIVIGVWEGTLTITSDSSSVVTVEEGQLEVRELPIINGAPNLRARWWGGRLYDNVGNMNTSGTNISWYSIGYSTGFNLPPPPDAIWNVSGDRLTGKWYYYGGPPVQKFTFTFNVHK